MCVLSQRMSARQGSERGGDQDPRAQRAQGGRARGAPMQLEDLSAPLSEGSEPRPIWQ